MPRGALDLATGRALPADLAIAELNASFRAIEKETEKELVKEMRRVGNEARDVVRRSTASPYRTGKTRKGIKTSVRRKSEIALVSNEAQAPVWEFGGRIRPRGRVITIPKTNFVSGAVLAMGDDIDERLADAFDSVARRHRFF